MVWFTNRTVRMERDLSRTFLSVSWRELWVITYISIVDRIAVFVDIETTIIVRIMLTVRPQSFFCLWVCHSNIFLRFFLRKIKRTNIFFFFLSYQQKSILPKSKLTELFSEKCWTQCLPEGEMWYLCVYWLISQSSFR